MSLFGEKGSGIECRNETKGCYCSSRRAGARRVRPIAACARIKASTSQGLGFKCVTEIRTERLQLYLGCCR